MEVLEKGDGTVILMVDLESEHGIVISLGGWAKGPGIKTSQVKIKLGIESFDSFVD